MNIPITQALPWVAMGILAAIAAILLHVWTRYPRDPTKLGFVLWFVVLYGLMALGYATVRGWITWS